MSRRSLSPDGITPEVMLRAYSIGVFPMAESADDPWLHWIEPRQRGVIPLSGLHMSHSLAKCVRGDHFDIRIDSDFSAVVEACAKTHGSTWISHRLRGLYQDIFEQGYAHSVEIWHNDRLVGGLYGISLGAAFFGESMFHLQRDASKVALVHLVARLISGGYRLLDTQFITPHLKRMGGIEIDRVRYLNELDQALRHDGDFYALPLSAHDNGRACLDIIKTHEHIKNEF